MFKNFIELFIAESILHPDKPAIIFHGKEISYKEVNLRSTDICLHLINSGIKSEQIIPMILERDPNTIIAMIAILKAGCAFLPISPITPCARIKFIFEDTKTNLVVSNINIDHLINENIQVIKPDDVKSSNNSKSNDIFPTQLAYVMYTSGSTGNPKGVLIEHSSMMNLFTSLIYELNITENDRFLALTDYTFDISLIELLMPLICGSTIILTEQGTVADGVKIRHYLGNYNITLMQATPLSWEILLKQGWKNDGAMKILVGGEKFRTSLAVLLDYKKENVWNMYGPTETSMWSMFNHINMSLTTESVPLGKTLKNTFIEILNDEMNPVEIGIQGELFIGGDGLARGYLNNSELTNKKFIYHPHSKAKLYRTGDLVIANKLGEICYIGRIDDQLKFGGIRIEAGEIESVIEQEPFVKKAVVKVHETDGFYKSLAAYIEVDEEKVFSNEIHAPGTDVSCFLRNIYDETYVHAEDYEHGIINNCGWQSSFTGQLLGVEELSESYKFIRHLIQKSDLSDILEIGCGTGSLLLEYIDMADECAVVEISSKAIDYVRSKLNKQQLQKVTFRNESAINVHNHQKYSCVIVNSVVQYLPSINYLITTITQLVSATRPNGTIIIGDVRSLELMDVYLLEKIRTNSVDAEDLFFTLSSYYYKSRDAEIVLSPKFFYALKNIIKEISQVDISVKHGDYKNELNYFRYDVILHINKPVKHQLPLSIKYDLSLDKQTLNNLIKENSKIPVIISKIPNISMQILVDLIDKDIPHHIPLPAVEQKIHVDNLLAEQIKSIIEFESETHEKFVHYDETNPVNDLEIHLYPKLNNQIIRAFDKNEYQNYRTYCREPFNPWLQKFCFDHVKLKVSQHVVSWVNPSVYVWIEKWPLNISGKLDKKKLQLPLNCEAEASDASTLQKLQTIWRNITGDNALVDKEFWVHGISSLCMYFFLATINEMFLVNINYHEFRDYNTLDKLSNYIEQLLELK